MLVVVCHIRSCKDCKTTKYDQTVPSSEYGLFTVAKKCLVVRLECFLE